MGDELIVNMYEKRDQWIITSNKTKSHSKKTSKDYDVNKWYLYLVWQISIMAIW